MRSNSPPSRVAVAIQGSPTIADPSVFAKWLGWNDVMLGRGFSDDYERMSVNQQLAYELSRAQARWMKHQGLSLVWMAGWTLTEWSQAVVAWATAQRVDMAAFVAATIPDFYTMEGSDAIVAWKLANGPK